MTEQQEQQELTFDEAFKIHFKNLWKQRRNRREYKIDKMFSERICAVCKKNKTTTYQRSDKTIGEQWYKHPNGMMCAMCYQRKRKEEAKSK